MAHYGQVTSQILLYLSSISCIPPYIISALCPQFNYSELTMMFIWGGLDLVILEYSAYARTAT